MKAHQPELLKSAAGILGVVALFVIASVVAHQYEAAIGGFVRSAGVVGPVVFILLSAICIVFLIPFDVSILIPLAIVSWGSFATALLSIAGWTIGSSVSLFLARRYGRPFVEHAIGAERASEAARRAPRAHLFWWVVAAQALVQVDFVSYAFGLFTDIRLAPYALATVIGDVVPGFFLAYVGDLPVWYEVAAITAGLALTGILFWRFVLRAR